MHLYEQRNDLIDIGLAPTVLHIFNGDDYIATLQTKIKSEIVQSIVFNTASLPSAIRLTLTSSTANGSNWELLINKYQSTLLELGQSSFTMTVIFKDGRETTLYEGLMIVTNRIYATNPFFSPFVTDRQPNDEDVLYQVGTLWIDIVDNSVFILSGFDDLKPVWSTLGFNLTPEDIITMLATKVDKKPNGVDDLIVDGKVNEIYLPIVNNKIVKRVYLYNVEEYLNDCEKYLSLYEYSEFPGQELIIHNDTIRLYINNSNPASMYENLSTNETFYITNQTLVTAVDGPIWDKLAYFDVVKKNFVSLNTEQKIIVAKTFENLKIMNDNGAQFLDENNLLVGRLKFDEDGKLEILDSEKDGAVLVEKDLETIDGGFL